MNRLLLLLLPIILLSCGNEENPISSEPSPNKAEGIRYAGARSSHYGFSEAPDEFSSFPSKDNWVNINLNVSQELSQTTPASLWIIGSAYAGSSYMEFPAPDDDRLYDNINFIAYDKHEEYLTHFDTTGIKLFLQIEPGLASVSDCIELVLSRYKHHPSVVGFGVDVEWYNSEGLPNVKDPLTVSQVEKWDAEIKAHNPEYRLFLKHWTAEMCGESPVSDVIYINDNQGESSELFLMAEFTKWANYYYPNDVGFQIGYPSAHSWWKELDNPLTKITASIDRYTPIEQQTHIFWVDFTLWYSEMNYLYEKTEEK